VGSFAKINAAIGWAPRISLAQSLRDILSSINQ
jgi:nucleoside-diphosphate-sugar epimerase